MSTVRFTPRFRQGWNILLPIWVKVSNPFWIPCGHGVKNTKNNTVYPTGKPRKLLLKIYKAKHKELFYKKHCAGFLHGIKQQADKEILYPPDSFHKNSVGKLFTLGTIANNRLMPFRPNRNNTYRSTGQLFHTANIGFGIFRQFIVRATAGNILVPTG